MTGKEVFMEKCCICQSYELLMYKHPKFDIEFIECLRCKTIYKSKKMKISEEKEKEIYNLHENHKDNLGYVQFLSNFILDAVMPFKKQGEVLDFGSGPNPVLKYILDHHYGFKTHIYDYYYHKDEKVFNHKYDVITSTEVFEHLWDPIKELKRLLNCLKPDGILAIMTLFRPKTKEEVFNWFYIRDPSHVIFYSEESFKYLAKMLNLKIIFSNHKRYIILKKKQLND